MNANQTETPNHRRTGMLPLLAAVATLAPAIAGLALATGRADAARPAVSFHCSNEHGNGTSANPLDDNTDHGLDAGATGANTVSSACGATTTVVTVTLPTVVVSTTLPAPVVTVEPNAPVLAPVTTAPVTTSPTTSAATTAPATTSPAVTPTMATLPEIVPLLTPSTSAATPTTTAATTIAPATTVPATTAVPSTTAPVTTVRSARATTIPVEIAPNDGAVVNPAVGLAFTVGRPTTDGGGPTDPGTGSSTAGAVTMAGATSAPGTATAGLTPSTPIASSPIASNPAISNLGRSTVGTYGSETMGLTPPPVEVLGISISRFADAATPPSGVADMLAFTGASSGHLTSLAGAAISLGLGLANLARRNRRIRRA